VTKCNEIRADRIRKYLGHLTLQARSSLLVEIERMQMYDEDISGFEIILSELRAEFRKSGQPNNRVGNPSRYFFKPIEALFVDRSPRQLRPDIARISGADLGMDQPQSAAVYGARSLRRNEARHFEGR
jgi:hypothetical protein